MTGLSAASAAYGVRHAQNRAGITLISPEQTQYPVDYSSDTPGHAPLEVSRDTTRRCPSDTPKVSLRAFECSHVSRLARRGDEICCRQCLLRSGW